MITKAISREERSVPSPFYRLILLEVSLVTMWPCKGQAMSSTHLTLYKVYRYLGVSYIQMQCQTL